MVKLALAVLLFLGAGPALAADTLNIAVIGDLQHHALCNLPDTAIDHFTTMIDWLVTNQDDIDVVVAPGDLTMDTPTGRSGPESTCECLAQGPAPCAQYTSHMEPTGCTECADVQATACKDGTAGRYCEQTRIRNGFDTLEAAGLPIIWTAGNHDLNMFMDTESPGLNPNWEGHNEYFGATRLTKNAKETGSFVAGNGSTSTYHVISAIGADWLFITVGYVFWNAIGAKEDQKYLVAGLEWAQTVMDSHFGMPTVIVSHKLYTPTYGWDIGATPPDDEFYAIIDPAMNANRQVFFNIGGHYGNPTASSSDGSGTKVAASGDVIVGMVHDYSYDARVGDGLPAWVLEDNGGGGVVAMVRVAPKAGSISSWSYSPEQDERVAISAGGDFSSTPTWVEHIPFCDEDRFNIPKSICARDSKVIGGCRGGSETTQNPSTTK